VCVFGEIRGHLHLFGETCDAQRDVDRKGGFCDVNRPHMVIREFPCAETTGQSDPPMEAATRMNRFPR
jgi:hypothetical protein